MASVTITNLSATEPLLIQDLYTSILPASSVIVQRSASQISSMTALQSAISAGLAAVSVTLSADEIASGLAQAAGTVQALDLAPVDATDVAAPLVVLRKSFAVVAGGAADDVVIFAASTVPYKMRILDVFALVSTQGNTGAFELRTAVGGAGTLVASVTNSGTGRLAMAATASAVVATTDALTIRRTTNSNSVGELVILARREN